LPRLHVLETIGDLPCTLVTLTIALLCCVALTRLPGHARLQIRLIGSSAICVQPKTREGAPEGRAGWNLPRAPLEMLPLNSMKDSAV
jgi:hypothetical protein